MRKHEPADGSMQAVLTDGIMQVSFKNIFVTFPSESRYLYGCPGNHTKVMYVGSDSTEDAMWLYARLLGTMQLTDDVAEG